MLKRLTAFYLFSLLFVSSVLIFGQSLSHPLALDRHPRGDLYVLTADGDVVEINLVSVKRGRLRLISSGKDMFGMQAGDVVAARIFDEEQVFVSGQSGGHARVFNYDLSGKLKRVYELPILGTGFDIDVKRHLIYVAGSLSSEIFRISMANENSEVLARIKSADSLGPLVVNPERDSLYVADQKTGTLYETNLSTGSWGAVLNGLGQPTGLAFDEQRGFLYIADGERGRVFCVDTKNRKNVVRVIETRFTGLTGIAPGANGHIFVSDRDTSTVYYLSATGDIVERFPK